MASVETFELVIDRFVGLLNEAGIPYMLTGSFASGFHGAPRATQDIDMVIAPDVGSLSRLMAMLDDEKYYVSRAAALDAFSRESLFNVIDFASGWKIDLICRKSRAFSQQEFERRVRYRLADQTIFVVSPEDAVLSKLEWAKTSSSERQIDDVAGIVRIQGEELDRDYIARWVEEMRLAEQWQAVLRKLGR